MYSNAWRIKPLHLQSFTLVRQRKHMHTCVAKRREQSDSWALSTSGAKATSIIAFPVLDRHGCRMCVSLELRYGTWALLLLSAAKMSARLLRDLLIACVSFSLSPSAWDLRQSR